MSRLNKWMVICGLGVSCALIVALPVYAQVKRKCAMCKTESKEVMEKLQSGNMTLTKAIEAAEKRSSGFAITAFTERDEDKIVFAVYCVSGDRIVVVDVDENGKAGRVSEAEDMPGIHDDEAHRPKPSPAG